MNDHPKSKNARVRVVPEASPPLDDENQLQLDEALAALGEQLRSEAQWLNDLAQDAQADVPSIQDDSLQQIAAQLTAEAQSVFEHAGPAAQPATSQPTQNTKTAWIAFAQRLLPVVAAAGLLVTIWAVRPANRTGPTDPGNNVDNGSSSVARLPEAPAPLDPFAPNEVAAPVPWQEMSSPELEGALDLVDEVVSISI